MSREKIIATIHEVPEVIHAGLAGSDKTVGHDEKLRTLTVSAGCLAALLADPGWSQNHLGKIYGLCSGWLLALGEKTPGEKICAERERQQELFKAGKFTFTCASRIADPVRKLRVLMEEIGEVAEAIEKLEMKKLDAACFLRSELTQVAAVAVAWLEALAAPATKEASK